MFSSCIQLLCTLLEAYTVTANSGGQIVTERKWDSRVITDQCRSTSNHGPGRSSRAGKARSLIVLLIGAVLPLALVVGCAPGTPTSVQGTASPSSPTTAASTTTQHTTTTSNSSSSGGSSSSSLKLFCKILRTGDSGSDNLQYDVTTNGETYDGRITVNFQDDAGHTFDPVSIQGASTNANWQKVPESDIGASAQPTRCTATAG